MKLVHIPGTQEWVNPDYVTSVRPWQQVWNEPRVECQSVIEFRGDTENTMRTSHSTATPDEIAALLNAESEAEQTAKLQELTAVITANNAKLISFFKDN